MNRFAAAWKAALETAAAVVAGVQARWDFVPAVPGQITTITSGGEPVTYTTDDSAGLESQNEAAAIVVAAVNFCREHLPLLLSGDEPVAWRMKHRDEPAWREPTTERPPDFYYDDEAWAVEALFAGSPALLAPPEPYVVANGKQGAALRFSTINAMGFTWTASVDEALQFARREDADRCAEGNEDAWRILTVGAARNEQAQPA